MDGSTEISDVEDCLADRSRQFRFPQRLEDRYQASVSRHRARAMRSTVALFAILYNALLLIDLLLLPQTFRLALVLHMGAVTPLIIGCMLVTPTTSARLRETLTAAIAIAMAAQILIVYAMNTEAARDQYQFLAIVTLVNMNVNQRLEYRFARLVSCLIAAAYTFVLLSSASPPAVQVIGVTSMAVAAYVTLSANKRMERDMRFVFLKRIQDQLHRQKAESEAVRDALTNLYNRRRLERQAARLWEGWSIEAEPIAALMIDVDRFKAFNDRYGHLAGDLCLKRIAGAITAELRNEHDLAVRYGGEEFLVLLPLTDRKEATRVAERMRRMIYRLAIPHEDGVKPGVVTASIGVVTAYPSLTSLEELITAADTALYTAKRNGRNAVWPPFLTTGRLPEPRVPSTAAV